MLRHAAAALLLCALPQTPATKLAVIARADFEGGHNEGGWTFRVFDQPTRLTPAGGNPGGALRDQACCDLFAPSIHTVGESGFTGDWRAAGASRVLADVRVAVLEPFLFPLSLRIATDAGTPDDPSDDFAAFLPGGLAHALPPQGGPWRTLRFDVPVSEPALPAGWLLVPRDRLFGELPPSPDWNVLVQRVSEVSLELGPSVPFWPFHYWDVSVDNVRLLAGARWEKASPSGAEPNGAL